MFGLSPFEMAAIGVIAVILFGGNLPDVARKLGGGYAELRRNLSEVQKQFRMAESEVRSTLDRAAPSNEMLEDDDEDDRPSVPKFKPPT